MCQGLDVGSLLFHLLHQRLHLREVVWKGKALELKGWLFSCSSCSPGIQSGQRPLSLPLSRCLKTQENDSPSESLHCLHRLTPPLPSSLSPSRVKMKTTVSISVRDGKMEVRKSSWEKENWGPWAEEDESPPMKNSAHWLGDCRQPPRTSNTAFLYTDESTEVQGGSVLPKMMQQVEGRAWDESQL